MASLQNSLQVDEEQTQRPWSVCLTRSWDNDGLSAFTDHVADEVPVALEYNGISHAVMLASPDHLEDFVTGFSLTEGIISSVQDIRDIQVKRGGNGITVKLEIAPQCFFHLKEKRRTLAGRTGCGLCGAESLDQVYRQPTPVTSAAHFSLPALHQAFRHLKSQQVLMQYTGATHAAGWLDGTGRLTLIREDVGRHNALDKLIGALARAGIDGAGGAVLVTSRASYEMVLKTAAAGIGFLAALSAPTSLAIQLAESAQLTLVGFVRGQRMNIYTHPERLNRTSEPDS